MTRTVFLVTLLLSLAAGCSRGDSDAGSAPSATDPPSLQPPQSQGNEIIDATQSEPQQVALDPDDPDRRAVLWWDCGVCGSPDAVLALTEDGFATRMVLPVEPDTGLAWAGDRQLILIDWADDSAQLIGFDGERRKLRLGAKAPVPADSTIVAVTLNHIWQSVWIDTATATAHPVPGPPEQEAAGSDNSLWNDANGLVWFGDFEDHYTIATSSDGGSTWTSHDLVGEHLVPTYSAAKGVLAVLEYEDANREALRLLRVWYSTDGGATWSATADSAVPTGRIQDQGGVIRTDGRLLMQSPSAGLIEMNRNWTFFEPGGYTPEGGHFEIITMTYGDPGSLTMIGHTVGTPDLYVSTNGSGNDWEPIAGR